MFDDIAPMAGRPWTEAIEAVGGIALPATIPSNASLTIIPDLARLAFTGIAGGDGLLGTDLFIAAPFAVGNSITVRLLLTAQ